MRVLPPLVVLLLLAAAGAVILRGVRSLINP